MLAYCERKKECAQLGHTSPIQNAIHALWRFVVEKFSSWYLPFSSQVRLQGKRSSHPKVISPEVMTPETRVTLPAIFI